MSISVLYESDIQNDKISNLKVAVIGYGSQGRAHALNLADSGVDVCVGLREGSSSIARVKEDGLVSKGISEAVQSSNLIMILTPDETQKETYETEISPYLKGGQILAFAHGFNIHFEKIEPRQDVDVIMVAPKGPGHTVRREYKNGSGVPCLVAIHQDISGEAKEIALSYAKAIGGARAGVFETTFKEETETDLFGEQAVLCGGLTHLIRAGFETLVEAGYSPAMAYFECLHEMKLIVDLVFEGGITNMDFSISNTAEYGSLTSGPRVVDDRVKEKMKNILKDIQSGQFADQWLEENKKGLPEMTQLRNKAKSHLIEKIGTEIRSKMKFPDQEKLVTEK